MTELLDAKRFTPAQVAAPKQNQPNVSPPASLTYALEADMARKVGVQKGNLIRRGPSWLIRFREYTQGGGGKMTATPRTERVGSATGPGALSRREAQRAANEQFLDEINRRNLKPSSSMLFSDFVQTKFQIKVVQKKKAGGKQHYNYILDTFLLKHWAHRRLCDITSDDVELLLSEVRQGEYSWQTAKHCRSTINRIFKIAKKDRLYGDENPAAGVDLGEQPRTKKRPGYTWQRAALVLNRLKSPAREMGKLSIATSMNVAEMCGIRLKWCNFTDRIVQVEGEVLGPYCIGVREHFYLGTYDSLKAGKRLRNVPLTPELAEELAAFVQNRGKYQGGEDPLFASRNGTPVDAHNIFNRQFRPLQLKLGFPVCWHAFRRAHSTFVGALGGIAIEDRMATMGHADAAMTLMYSIEDVERRRAIPARILAQLDEQDVPADLEEMDGSGGVQ